MRILVVEDSERMGRTLKRGLTEEGYAVEVVADGRDALGRATGGAYDLILLDVNLPGMDGFSFARRLRQERSDVPVLMVTARDAVEDRVTGLDAGADDYLLKPFRFEELLARIRALLRRPGARREPVLAFGDLRLDPAKGQAFRGERALALSAREFALLRFFLHHAGEVLSRGRIYDAVWSVDYDGGSNVLEVYVNYLRNKLEAEGEPRVLHTVRGRGYTLDRPEGGA